MVTPNGQMLDPDRVMYLRNCLTHFRRATAEGYPLKGYSCGACSTISNGPTATPTASASITSISKRRSARPS